MNALKAFREVHDCTVEGSLFHSAMVCGKKEYWCALVCTVGHWSMSEEEFLRYLCNTLVSTGAEGIEMWPLNIWYKMESFRQCRQSSRVGILRVFIVKGVVNSFPVPSGGLKGEPLNALRAVNHEGLVDETAAAYFRCGRMYVRYCLKRFDYLHVGKIFDREHQ